MADLEKNNSLNEILSFFQDYLGEKSVGRDTLLLKELILDSVRTVELVYFLEQKFNLKIPSPQMIPCNFATPAAIADLLDSLLRVK